MNIKKLTLVEFFNPYVTTVYVTIHEFKVDNVNKCNCKIALDLEIFFRDFNVRKAILQNKYDIFHIYDNYL